MERIVLGYDGSPASRAALSWVSARARRGNARVDIVTVVGRNAHESEGEGFLAEAEAFLREDRPELTIGLHRLQGAVVDALAGCADDADLLVIGITTGHPLRAALAGWLPLRLTRLARIPVCLVPTGWAQNREPVTVGIADDHSSDAALAFAADEAALSPTSLRLVHAWLMPTPVFITSPVVDPMPEAVVADHRQTLTAAVERVVDRHPSVDLETELIRDSDAAALLRFVPRASLLVIGTHRAGLLSSTLLGSVAQDIVWRAACPVCVVPSPAAA